MKTLLIQLLRISALRPFALRVLVRLDNLVYKLLSQLAILENDGIHPKHRILNYHAFFTNNIRATDRVLDLGCGNGANAYDIAEKAREVVGIDLDPRNIKVAERRFSRPNLHYQVGDATVTDANGTFDVIVLSNVLEHIEKRVEFLNSLHPLSNKILLRVPMINRDWLTIYKKEHRLEYRLDPTHFIEFTTEILNDELRRGGWKIQNFSIQFGECWAVVLSASL